MSRDENSRPAIISLSFGDAAVAAVDIYPPPTKCTISIRSSSFNIVLLQSLRRTTSRLSSTAIRATGRSSSVINSTKEEISTSLSSPLTKTFISHKKAQKAQCPSFCAFCAFLWLVCWVDDAAELGGLVFCHRAN